MDFLSIDWDFFLYNAMASNQKDKTALLYDWGHSEGQTAGLQHVLWQSRAAGFAINNLDIVQESGIRLDRGCIPLEDFANTIHERFPELTGTSLLIGDSHSLAAGLVDDCPVDTVWHFDAHHDLGYGNTDLERQIRDGVTDCAAWLFHTLRLNLARRAVIVYPDWRGLSEWCAVDERPHLEPYAERIEVMTWKDFVVNESNRSSADLQAFLCRSSSWTPPWFDEQFKELINHLSMWETVCLDCQEGEGDYFDCCQKRPVPDFAADVEAMKQVRAMFEASRAKP